jgi:pyruvate-ferredoxin/flavodoxin oxidoreductase
VLKVRLFRPFDAELFVKALPSTVEAIAVLDRTKDPGALGEPLYEDVRTAIAEVQAAGHFSANPLVLGGRYGLGSK